MVSVDVLAHVPPLLVDDQGVLPGLSEALGKARKDGETRQLHERFVSEASRLFEAKGASGELRQFSSTGRSNSRPMQWCRMQIAANLDFPLHAHPNIEVVYVAEGKFYEKRLGRVPTTPEAIAQGEEYPIDLSEEPTTSFVEIAHESDSFLVNEIGSVHKSYTKQSPCELLVLWGGCHLNIPRHLTPPLCFTKGEEIS